MAFVPIRIAYSNVKSSDDSKTRLHNVLDGVKATWDTYLSNPQLIHMTSFASMQKEKLTVVRHPCAMHVTNIGVIDRLIPTTWLEPNTGNTVITIKELVFGHRVTDLRG